MASFKMINSRTKIYNSDGSRIYNTFNSTGLVNKYENHNSRFDSRNKGRKSDLVDSNGNKLNSCSCTITGCGTQCCRNYFLIQNINFKLWKFKSTYGFDYGTVLEPGNKIFMGYIDPQNTPPPTPSSIEEIGIIEDILFPNSNACIPLGEINAHDCSGAFPINVRIIVRSSGNSCVLKERFINTPQKTTGLFFKNPNGGNFIGGVWTGIKNLDPSVSVEHESYKVLGSSKVGAPYRAPIAGYRKTLACCCRSNKGNSNCYKGCLGPSYIELSLPTNIKFQTPMPMRGEYVYLKNGTFFGTVTDFGYSSQGPQLRFSFKNDNTIEKKIHQLILNQSNSQIYLYRADGSLYQYMPFTFNPKFKKNLCVSKEATNDVYKDSYAISCQQDTRVCYDRRIRSGMQPKQQFCVEYKDKRSGKKHKRLLCPTDSGWQKPYSFSYSQYNKNRAMNTYERGLEKNLPIQDDSNSSCPQGEKCKNSLYPNSTCCEKSQYRKSGGNACINCLPTNNPSANLLSKNAVTVWKPNNKKFKVQGAVCAGSRMERLKLDTIRSANSKCKRGEINERCHPDGNGKGKYFAGKPRFTGWMYNAKHLERVWPNRNISAIRYRPQPFGIPQLTNKGRSTRSNHGQPTWKPHSSGTYGYNQRTDSHNIRAPGYGNKCVANCPMPDCVKPIGKRTFKEWSDEYEGINNARYQGNRKCQEKATFSIKT